MQPISQSANNTSALKSNITFSSYFPSLSELRYGHVVVQLGGYWSSQGEAQKINVKYLAGNHYTVNNNNPSNGLFGLGYFVDSLDKDRFKLAYGINGLYLAATPVKGNIIQEDADTNLSYSYAIQHIPVYFAVKAIVKNNSGKYYNVTLDAGIGPNFMRTSHYNETPKEDYTIADNGFASHTNVAFSAMAGIGLRLNNIFGNAPLECGYRFLYLGQGQLAMNNNQLLNTLKTGNTYANAILCAITV